MRKRGHKRRDANQAQIVRALRQVGATVEILSDIGHGCPDLLVAPKYGALTLMEVKDGSKLPSEQKLTPDEAQWIELWNSRVFIVKSVDEALAAIGLA
jgi:hypothetical protein